MKICQKPGAVCLDSNMGQKKSYPKLYKAKNHKSACLSCAWDTGGQNNGFVNETGDEAGENIYNGMLKA
ncbi:MULTISPECIES: hypothetical protein [Planktothricoides]|uniref:Uncharacterized protein n=1 Tax=Planktothricoides raciborskii FACHB-1370 TaxID=2949576 RepID=A0ABR8EA88_9CYAN|nr:MULTISPECIES: hypothetical protein [Planktothricoides]KOR38156.1 hypothetical protein AM228_03135 [Planktothricoides sp. SR001]MBD2542625.1 hypothetical protein [Planktothricoides raciborskii FACHB-1370]MBD2581082.1 hypothetical protein [Planktothricoides raciborskii FACHB-1261]